MARLKYRNDSYIYIHIYFVYTLYDFKLTELSIEYRPLVEFININPFMEIRFVSEFLNVRNPRNGCDKSVEKSASSARPMHVCF